MTWIEVVGYVIVPLVAAYGLCVFVEAERRHRRRVARRARANPGRESLRALERIQGGGR